MGEDQDQDQDQGERGPLPRPLPRPLPEIALADWRTMHPAYLPAICGRCRLSLSGECVERCSPEGYYRHFSIRWDRYRTLGEWKQAIQRDDLLDPRLSHYAVLKLVAIHAQVNAEWERGRR